MASEVEIANLALSNIRAGSINSLNEASLQAQQCKLKYPVVRDMLLRDFPWQFAHSIAPLALLTDEIFNYAYTYQYPSDCLYVNRLILNWESVEANESAISTRYYDRDLYGPNLKAQVAYSVFNISGNKVIASNEQDLRIDYRARVTDPNLFDSTFIMALAHLLAAEVAISIVGVEAGRVLRSESLKMYNTYVASAANSNMNEQYHESSDSEFITGRF